MTQLSLDTIRITLTILHDDRPTFTSHPPRTVGEILPHTHSSRSTISHHVARIKRESRRHCASRLSSRTRRRFRGDVFCSLGFGSHAHTDFTAAAGFVRHADLAGRTGFDGRAEGEEGGWKTYTLRDFRGTGGAFGVWMATFSVQTVFIGATRGEGEAFCGGG